MTNEQKPEIEMVFSSHSPEGIGKLKDSIGKEKPDLFLSERFGYSDEDKNKLGELSRGEVSVDDYFDDPGMLFGTTSRAVSEADEMLAGTNINVDFADLPEAHHLVEETEDAYEAVEDALLPKTMPWVRVVRNVKAFREMSNGREKEIWQKAGVSLDVMERVYDLVDELPEETDVPSELMEIIKPHLTAFVNEINYIFGDNAPFWTNAADHFQEFMDEETKFVDEDREGLFQREMDNLRVAIQQQGEVAKQREAFIVQTVREKLDEHTPSTVLVCYGTAHSTMRSAFEGTLGDEYKLRMLVYPHNVIFEPSTQAQRLVVIGKEIPEDLVAQIYIENVVKDWIHDRIWEPFRESKNVRLNEAQWRMLNRLLLKRFNARYLQQIFHHSKGLSDMQHLLVKGIDAQVPEILRSIQLDPKLNRVFPTEIIEALKTVLR